MKEKELSRVLRKLSIECSHKDGDWLICKCPFALFRHEKRADVTPSFGVKIEPNGTSGFNCWSCHSKGTLPNLAFQLGRLRKVPELIKLGHQIEQDEILGANEIDFGEWGNGKTFTEEKIRIKVSAPNQKELYEKYQSVFNHTEGLRYLLRRRIHVDTIAEADIRYDKRQERALFPVYDVIQGPFAGFTGRLCWGETLRNEREKSGQQFDPRFKIPKVRDYGGLTKRSVLLARPDFRTRIINESNVIIVEGLFAYLRLSQMGYRQTVAILGSAVTYEKAEIIKKLNKPVYWFTDNDLAGKQCLHGLFNYETNRYEGGGALDILYKSIPQYTVSWPEGKNDPDDLTHEEVESMLENAEFYAKAH